MRRGRDGSQHRKRGGRREVRRPELLREIVVVEGLVGDNDEEGEKSELTAGSDQQQVETGLGEIDQEYCTRLASEEIWTLDPDESRQVSESGQVAPGHSVG
jgi:hypothetical protein